MNAIATIPRYTPDDLLAMPNGDRFELVDGELVERLMGWESVWISGEILYVLRDFCKLNSQGLVVPGEAGYRCFPDAPEKVRRPDVSFVSFSRLPPPQERRGHLRIAPDLAVEVISPNDLYEEVEEKVREYLSVGVKLVWIVNPATRTVRVHRLDGTVKYLTENDELSGEDVLPGFSCRVSRIFEEPTPA